MAQTRAGTYKRIERVLLNAGITERRQLDQFDKRGGLRGIKGIGPVLERVLKEAMKMSPSEFAVAFPRIAQEDVSVTWADTVEDQYFEAGGQGVTTRE